MILGEQNMKRYTMKMIIWILILSVGLVPVMPRETWASGITLVLNGSILKTDVAPIIIGGRTLVPIRVISENMGAQVGWEDATQTVTIKQNGLAITMVVGNPKVTVNGVVKTLDTYPRIISGRTMVPIRFISETFGATVDWIDSTQTVVIQTKGRTLNQVVWTREAGYAQLQITLSEKGEFMVANPEPGLLEIRMPRTMLGIATGTHIIQEAGVEDYTVIASTAMDAVVRIRMESQQAWRQVMQSDGRTLQIQFPGRITDVGMTSLFNMDGIRIQGTGPVTYRAFTLTDPLRVVVDVQEAVLTGSQAPISVGNQWLEQIRMSQYDASTVRVVADLKQRVGFSVHNIEGGIFLGFAPLIQAMTLNETDQGGTLSIESHTRWVGPSPVMFTGHMELSIPNGAVDSRTQIQINHKDGRTVVFDLAALIAGVPTGNPYMTKIRVDPSDPKQLVIRVDLAGDGAMTKASVNQQEVAYGFTVVSPLPLAGKKIAIDAGHGGRQPGAVGAVGLLEKDVNLAVALMLRDLLEGQGATVFMTRDRDMELTSTERALYANSTGAHLFVSIHANGAESPAANGTETYYAGNHADSSRLATDIQRKMVKHLERRDRGVKTASFTTIALASMPACLVELAFITNPEEELLLASNVFRQKAALGLRDGILTYFGK